MHALSRWSCTLRTHRSLCLPRGALTSSPVRTSGPAIRSFGQLSARKKSKQTPPKTIDSLLEKGLVKKAAAVPPPPEPIQGAQEQQNEPLRNEALDDPPAELPGQYSAWKEANLDEILRYQLKSPELLAAAKSQPSGKRLHPTGFAHPQPWDRVVDSANSRVFGNQGFRPFQRMAINAALSFDSMFVLLPTGGGKSLCFQLPALLQNGTTVVVSPLLALIHDQVSKLQALGIPVDYLSSGQSERQASDVFSRFSRGATKLLYITPERIAVSPSFMSTFAQLYERQLIPRLVVDESHCVSEWGHDFRPNYLKLNLLRTRFPDLPITCLTAVASPQVQKDVIQILQMRDAVTFQSSFLRTNFVYQVKRKDEDTTDDIWRWIKKHHPNDSGIVFCTTCRDAEKLAEVLQDRDLAADYYHGNLSPPQRAETQSKFMDGRIKVICTTIAFALGIDKSDVRFVLHHSLPRSLEEFYQQTGRAGRDGKEARCILFYRRFDRTLLQRMAQSAAQEAQDQAGGYEEVASDVDRLSFKEEKLSDVVAFCEERRRCRVVMLVEHFGENASPCGKCDNCLAIAKEKERRKKAPLAFTRRIQM